MLRGLVSRLLASAQSSCTSPGRAVARTGLRMMPTFPPLPLKFRTAGFPSVRLQGRYIGRAFSVEHEFVAPCSLHPPFVHLAACNVVSPF